MWAAQVSDSEEEGAKEEEQCWCSGFNPKHEEDVELDAAAAAGGTLLLRSGSHSHWLNQLDYRIARDEAELVQKTTNERSEKMS